MAYDQYTPTDITPYTPTKPDPAAQLASNFTGGQVATGYSPPPSSGGYVQNPTTNGSASGSGSKGGGDTPSKLSAAKTISGGGGSDTIGGGSSSDGLGSPSLPATDDQLFQDRLQAKQIPQASQAQNLHYAAVLSGLINPQTGRPYYQAPVTPAGVKSGDFTAAVLNYQDVNGLYKDGLIGVGPGAQTGPHMDQAHAAMTARTAAVPPVVTPLAAAVPTSNAPPGSPVSQLAAAAPSANAPPAAPSQIAAAQVPSASGYPVATSAARSSGTDRLGTSELQIGLARTSPKNFVAGAFPENKVGAGGDAGARLAAAKAAAEAAAADAGAIGQKADTNAAALAAAKAVKPTAQANPPAGAPKHAPAIEKIISQYIPPDIDSSRLSPQDYAATQFSINNPSGITEKVTNVPVKVQPGAEPPAPAAARGGIGGVWDSVVSGAQEAGGAVRDAALGFSDRSQAAISNAFSSGKPETATATPSPLEAAKAQPPAMPAVPAPSPADKVMSILGLDSGSPELSGIGQKPNSPAATPGSPENFYHGVIKGPADEGAQGAAPVTRGVQVAENAAHAEAVKTVMDVHAQQPPEVQAQIEDRALILSQAASIIAGAPAGPKRDAIGRMQLDTLLKAGTIDQKTHDDIMSDLSDQRLGKAMAIGDVITKLRAQQPQLPGAMQMPPRPQSMLERAKGDQSAGPYEGYPPARINPTVDRAAAFNRFESGVEGVDVGKREVRPENQKSLRTKQPTAMGDVEGGPIPIDDASRLSANRLDTLPLNFYLGEPKTRTQEEQFQRLQKEMPAPGRQYRPRADAAKGDRVASADDPYGQGVDRYGLPYEAQEPKVWAETSDDVALHGAGGGRFYTKDQFRQINRNLPDTQIEREWNNLLSRQRMQDNSFPPRSSDSPTSSRERRRAYG